MFLAIIFDPEHLQCTYLELLEAEQMGGLLEITPTQQKHLEEITRGQSKLNIWLHFRSRRVIASFTISLSQLQLLVTE